jgi:16S rRNA (uracil1498-N3)-methyltransferase
MRIFVLPPEFNGSKTFRLNRKDSHYLTRVLRLEPGALIPGRDRSGQLWDLLLSSADPQGVLLTCSPAAEHERSVSDPRVRIHLFQAVCKSKKMDQIIRQAAEIGAASITPIITRFTVSSGAGSRENISKQKFERWGTIITEAIQQSGSPILTKLNQPISLEEMIRIVSANDNQSIRNHDGKGEFPGFFGVFFHQERLCSQTLADIARDYSLLSGPLPVAAAVGPEGGFSPEEVENMQKAGMKPAFLKTNILRAETAAVYALAVLQTLLLEEQP